MTRSAQTAEDITQDCFVAFVRAPERFDGAKGTVRSYLFSIARNLTLKHIRDSAGEEQMADGAEPQGRDPRPELEAAATVERAIAALPALEREALILFQYEGLTLAEISQAVGADVGTVKGRLYRARTRLKVALAPYRRVGERNGME